MTRIVALTMTTALVAGALFAGSSLTTANETEARELRRGWVAGGPGGARAWGGATIHRGGGQAWGSRTVQGRYGRGATSNFTRSCGGGTCTRHSTVTTNAGRTWTRSGTVTRNGSGNWSTYGTTTGPDGETWSRSGRTVRTGPGAWSRDVTHTGPNGNSVNRHVDGACAGWACRRTVTTTGPNGGTTTRNRWVLGY